MAVANVYFAQPLLKSRAADLSVEPGLIGIVVTATQIGYGIGLVFIVPLGDLLNREALIFAVQAVHVTHQSLIFAARPDAQSRLVGAYMCFYSVGSALGAVAATQVYAQWGWSAVCLLGAAISLAAWLLLVVITTQNARPAIVRRRQNLLSVRRKPLTANHSYQPPLNRLIGRTP